MNIFILSFAAAWISVPNAPVFEGIALDPPMVNGVAGVPEFVFQAARGTVLTALPAEMLNDADKGTTATVTIPGEKTSSQYSAGTYLIERTKKDFK